MLSQTLIPKSAHPSLSVTLMDREYSILQADNEYSDQRFGGSTTHDLSLMFNDLSFALSQVTQTLRYSCVRKERELPVCNSS